MVVNSGFFGKDFWMSGFCLLTLLFWLRRAALPAPGGEKRPLARLKVASADRHHRNIGGHGQRCESQSCALRQARLLHSALKCPESVPEGRTPFGPTQPARLRLSTVYCFLPSAYCPRTASYAAAFDVDLQAFDFLVEGGERDLEALGGFGLAPVGAVEHIEDDAALARLHNLKQ